MEALLGNKREREKNNEDKEKIEHPKNKKLEDEQII